MPQKLSVTALRRLTAVEKNLSVIKTNWGCLKQTRCTLFAMATAMMWSALSSTILACREKDESKERLYSPCRTALSAPFLLSFCNFFWCFFVCLFFVVFEYEFPLHYFFPFFLHFLLFFYVTRFFLPTRCFFVATPINIEFYLRKKTCGYNTVIICVKSIKI